MSGFYLLALIAIWLFTGWIIYRFWRRWKPAALGRKILHIVIGVLLFSAWFGGAFWEVVGKKEYYDAQVRKLCAQDGGVRVYETVELPADQFDKYGNVHIPSKDRAAPQDSYYYEREIQYLRNDDPKITRTHHVIIRRSDGKVLGESIHYSRGGGDLPGPWHPSSYICPPILKDHVGIEKQIFKRRS